MSQVISSFFMAAKSGATVTLSPIGETLPNHLGINQITISTTNATAPTDFWDAVANCSHYEFIIRKKSQQRT